MEKIQVKRKNALEALAIGGAFAGKNKVIPILDSVKCKFLTNGTLSVSSHDGQNAIVKRVDGVVCESDCIFCINFADFSKALKALSSEDVNIEVAVDKIAIVHKKGRIELPISGIDDFPNVELGDIVKDTTMPSLVLKNWVSTARNFVADDNIRPVMCAMYLYMIDGEVGVCATNGTKLYTDSYVCDGCQGENLSAIIPANCLSTIQSIIGDDEIVRVMLYGRNIAFSTNDTKVTCLLLDGRFPNFKAVIPQSHKIEVECGVGELYESVSRVCGLAGGATRLVKMSVEGMALSLESEDRDFYRKANEECMCSHSGDNIVFGANGDVLCTCLNAISNDNVVMCMTESSRAIVLRDPDNERQTLLFMPLMLS